ncbi:MAG: dTDP-4-dehydrorhamnose 3,5-epimerase family protein [Nitrospirae bacterium]|nr:dTDP-4-dehydrorhamnose 3,5-epimerase family protein [Nitrospirota bacterium]
MSFKPSIPLTPHRTLEGVELKQLQTHADGRGFFRELIRVTDDFFREGFGQWSISRMHVGVIKAWHLHEKQVDWWYVNRGVIKVALHDTRPDSITFRRTMELLMGDHHPPVILRIPPGVAHGCRCLDGPAELFYITSRVYDPSDEGRIPHDDPEIGYDWLSGPPIK